MKTMRGKRQVIAIAMFIVFLTSSTSLLHLLTPSIEGLINPDVDSRDKEMRIFNSIHHALNITSQLDQKQTALIQNNRAEAQAITAILTLKTMVNAYTVDKGQPYPSIAYSLAEDIVVQMINAGLIEQNLPRHTQLDQMNQIFAYSSYQSQTGSTCSYLSFHGTAKYIIPNLRYAHKVIGIHGPMLEIESQTQNQKLILLNLVSKQFKDGSVAALHVPWSVNVHLDLSTLPFMLRTVHGHFLEKEGIIALTPLTLYTKCFQTNVIGRLKDTPPQAHNLRPGEVAVIHSGCEASIQLNGNHVASRAALKSKHKDKWLSAEITRDTHSEAIIAEVHKLAIQQETANYQVKLNAEKWQRESTMHIAYSSSIILILVASGALFCAVCYCNSRHRRTGKDIEIINMNDTPARKTQARPKVLFSKNKETTTATTTVTVERKASSVSLEIGMEPTYPTAPTTDQLLDNPAEDLPDDEEEEQAEDEYLQARVEECQKQTEKLRIKF